MRPIVVRALTAALATGGAVWAIVLPTLTLGEARSPSHAFSVPAPGGDLVIEASRLATPALAHPSRIAARQATARHAQTRAIISVAAPARVIAPVTSPRPVAAPLKPVPAVVPQAPTPAPQPQPQPQPQPAAEPAVRTLASVVVTEQPTQAAEDDAGQHKQHKDKPHKQKKPKHDKGSTDGVALPPASPPAATPNEAVTPVEPAAVGETDQDEPEQDAAGKDNDGKEHGTHGKGHDKKK